MEDVAVVILPSLAASSVILLLIFKLYLNFRKYFPVTVECWFCCKKTKVPFEKTNSWDCPHCDQYNGFTEDGGYNKLIPAQHDEFLNEPLYAMRTSLQAEYNRQGPALCANCNRNQQLKVAQLAMFVAVDPGNYDYEIEQYSQQLEKVYNLCWTCEETVKEVVKSQQKTHGEERNTKESWLPQNKGTQKGSKSPTTVTLYITIVVCILQIMCLLKDVVPYNAWLQNAKNYTGSLLDAGPLPEWLLPSVDAYLEFFNPLIVSTKARIPDYVVARLELPGAFDFILVSVCIFVYSVELLRLRNTASLLNAGSWVILMSLKCSRTPWTFVESLVQGLAALVFVFVSVGTLRDRRKPNPPSSILRKECASRKDSPQRTQQPSSFDRAPKISPKKGSPKPRPPLETMLSPSRNVNLLETFPPEAIGGQIPKPARAVESHAPKDDLGFSHLNIGPRKPPLMKNHLMDKPKPYCRRQNDQIWSRSSVLSPARFTYGSDFTGSPPPPMSRSSSPSSGLGSLGSQPAQENTSSAFRSVDFDRISDHGPAIDEPNKYAGCIAPYYYSDIFQPSPLPISPMTYYHFAAHFHQLYSSPSTGSPVFNQSSSSSSPFSGNTFNGMPSGVTPMMRAPVQQPHTTQFFQSVWYPISVLTLVIVNLLVNVFFEYAKYKKELNMLN